MRLCNSHSEQRYYHCVDSNFKMSAVSRSFSLKLQLMLSLSCLSWSDYIHPAKTRRERTSDMLMNLLHYPSIILLLLISFIYPTAPLVLPCNPSAPPKNMTYGAESSYLYGIGKGIGTMHRTYPDYRLMVAWSTSDVATSINGFNTIHLLFTDSLGYYLVLTGSRFPPVWDQPASIPPPSLVTRVEALGMESFEGNDIGLDLQDVNHRLVQTRHQNPGPYALTVVYKLSWDTEVQWGITLKSNLQVMGTVATRTKAISRRTNPFYGDLGDTFSVSNSTYGG